MGDFEKGGEKLSNDALMITTMNIHNAKIRDISRLTGGKLVLGVGDSGYGGISVFFDDLVDMQEFASKLQAEIVALATNEARAAVAASN